MRYDGREANDELRQIKIIRDYLKYPQGSVLIEFGDTKVICTAMVEEKVPPFLKGSGQGWVSAQYAMLPAANATRKQRDIDKLKLDSRSAEIQRLIGRSLRAAVDLKALGERTVWIDCDVIQADGGTRVASITGSFIALYDAVGTLLAEKHLRKDPMIHFVAAVSVGIVDDELLLDLCYHEDSRAQADMNVVMTDAGEFVELQATGEGRTVTPGEMSALMEMAAKGIGEIIRIQKETVGYKK
ncbi:MAG: ribonuclease PH [Eubacteriaceae bacterium]|nr:ribonuclease PH [Eubacteriaceae bacterium]